MNFIYFIKKIKKMPKRILLSHKMLLLLSQKKVLKKKKIQKEARSQTPLSQNEMPLLSP